MSLYRFDADAGLGGAGEAASYTSLINETVAEAVHRVQYAAKVHEAGV
jgi:hypothetical protein